MPRTPLEAYAFDARFGKRSVFILDPRLLKPHANGRNIVS